MRYAASAKFILILAFAGACLSPQSTLARGHSHHAVVAYSDCGRFHLPVFDYSRGQFEFSHLVAVHYCGRPSPPDPSNFNRSPSPGGVVSSTSGVYHP